MRKVKVSIKRYDKNLYKHIEISSYFGLFHQWGFTYEEIGDTAGNRSVAIVEDEKGKINLVTPENIQFINNPDGNMYFGNED